jgi:hypothetical protein
MLNNCKTSGQFLGRNNLPRSQGERRWTDKLNPIPLSDQPKDVRIFGENFPPDHKVLQATAYMKWLWGGIALIGELLGPHLYLYRGNPDLYFYPYPNPEERGLRKKRKRKPQRGHFSWQEDPEEGSLDFGFSEYVVS